MTYQLLDSSESVGLMDSFNSSRKNRRWAISNRTSKEVEVQDEEAAPVHGEPANTAGTAGLPQQCTQDEPLPTNF